MGHPGLDWSARAVQLFPLPDDAHLALFFAFVRGGTARERERVPFGDG